MREILINVEISGKNKIIDTMTLKFINEADREIERVEFCASCK